MTSQQRAETTTSTEASSAFKITCALGVLGVFLAGNAYYTKNASAPSVARAQYSGDNGCLAGTDYAEKSGGQTYTEIDTNGNEQIVIAANTKAGDLPELVFDVDRTFLINTANLTPTRETEALLPADC